MGMDVGPYFSTTSRCGVVGDVCIPRRPALLVLPLALPYLLALPCLLALQPLPRGVQPARSLMATVAAITARLGNAVELEAAGHVEVRV